MNWKRLISDKRYNQRRKKDKSTRSNFEMDYDRIIFSSAFRTLQDKTQVIPLPENSFVHNRLTHSLETASVGRSLGKMVGEKLIKKYSLNYTAADFGVIVASACLAHDIGNPPFGHSGESSISHYFKKGKGQRYKDVIQSEAQWLDLTNFEGNANGFKLLTNFSGCLEGGINLSYSTLAAFTKYPRGAKKIYHDTSITRTSQKKYGYFQSERDIFEAIFDHLGVLKLADGNYARHPLAFLVEAADDICYRIIDFEDGIRIGWIDRNTGIDLFFDLIGKDFKEDRFNAITDPDEQLSYLRAITINKVIKDIVEIFLNKEEDILQGLYDKPLLNELKYKQKLDAIVNMSIKLIYNNDSVVKIEVAGFKIVSTLLDTFINAFNDWHNCSSKKSLKKQAPLSFKLITLLPQRFQIMELPPKNLYHRIMEVVESVSRMSDKHALNLFKTINGLNI